MAVFISDNTDIGIIDVINQTSITKDKLCYLTMIKILVQQDDITILTLCVPNNRFSKYTK